MIQVTAVGRTDVGRVRDANEDSFHVGDSVFAVADGMGGHLAGEVASETALQPIAALDGRVFPDEESAVGALRQAVIDANDRVVDKAANDPKYSGMGTTLTAGMVEGPRLHLAHVGDSRAYLLRDGRFSQITDDHTLVQRLVDEGRLTPEQAATHPQRSIITRAIGVESDVNVDSLSLEARPGDLFLLCSDGLTGPVPDEDLVEIMGSSEDLDEVVDALVDAALRNGAPDNVTAVLVRFEAIHEDQPRSTNTVSVSSRPGETGSQDWAARLGRLGTLGSSAGERGDESDSRSSSPGRAQRIGAIIIAVSVLAGIVLAGGRWMLSRSYYVGLDDRQVVIYQGIPADLGPVPLSWAYEETELTLDDVPTIFHDDLADGVTATDLADARRIIDNYEEQVADGTDDAEPSEPSEPSEASDSSEPSDTPSP